MGTATATTQRLAEAAEAEFASRGIDGASVRRIAVAAGQRNTNAVGYHFGSKSDLADRVYELRQPRLDGRRGDIIAALTTHGPLDVRGAVTAVVQPFCEALEEPWGRQHLRFSRHYSHWMQTTGPGLAAARAKRLHAAPNYVTALDALDAALAAIDARTRTTRMLLFERLLPDMLAVVADDPSAGAHSTALLVDMWAAALAAPTPDDEGTS